VLVTAQPVDRAYDLLASMFGVASVSRQNGSIRLDTDPAGSLEINSRLMAAGIGVSELRPIERSLEEAFFQLTGEKQGS
jgi:ABC-2 type transport system ATP-binding protein